MCHKCNEQDHNKNRNHHPCTSNHKRIYVRVSPRCDCFECKRKVIEIIVKCKYPEHHGSHHHDCCCTSHHNLDEHQYIHHDSTNYSTDDYDLDEFDDENELDLESLNLEDEDYFDGEESL